MQRFIDRRDAGRALAAEISRLALSDNTLVLGLPRGGVVVADEVAHALGAPLDVFVVRKLGVPGHEELAMGAIASGGIRVLNEEVIQDLDIPDSAIEAVTAVEATELARRERLYRSAGGVPEAAGKDVVIVDDGLATGATMLAAVKALKALGPRRVIVAVPVASEEACAAVRDTADITVCLTQPRPFFGVGAWYDDFSQTADEEVREIIGQSNSRESP
jgi:predicted phosphoribosyltransferase